MKNVVRAFVFSLAVSGAFASTPTHVAMLARTQHNALPVPNCPPGSDPSACSICKANGWCVAGE